MSNARSQYPVVVNLPPPRDATLEEARAVQGKSGAYGAGATLRRQIAAATDGLLGRTFRQLLSATPLPGPVLSAVSPLATTQGGRVATRNFVDGLVGAPKGGRKVPVATATPPSTPVVAAMAAGRQSAESPLTPQEKMLAHLDTLLSRPMTLRGMAAVSGALSQTTANSPRPASAKDNVLASTAEISQAAYDAQVKDIMAKRAAGSMTLEQARDATAKATDAYFLRNTALVGNPLSFAQANMLPAPAQIEE